MQDGDVRVHVADSGDRSLISWPKSQHLEPSRTGTDVHHIGQLLVTDFESSVAFYRDPGLDLRETTTGAPGVALFETPSADHLVVREERRSAADALPDTVGRHSAAHVAFAVDGPHEGRALGRANGIPPHV